jgi:NADPH:quinone reductase-like Zn-dependent oxidoreductase
MALLVIKAAATHIRGWRGQETGERTIMKAFVVDRYEKRGDLRLAEMPEPALRDDDVLVEIHASGLNLLDSKIRDGEFKLILPYRPPFILGHDVAGTVVRVGSKVRQFKPGDAIYARPRMAGQARSQSLSP